MSTAGAPPPPPAIKSPTVPASATSQETRNTISQPSGPQFQLLLGEGTYILRDEIALGPIPPHPSESVIQNPNVLDPKPSPPTAGSRLSIAILAPRPFPAQFRRPPTAGSSKSPLPSNVTDTSGDSSRSSTDHSSALKSNYGFAGRRSRFGEGNPALLPPNGKDAKDPQKRKKPKNNITKSSSSFVSRAIPHDNITKRLNEHQMEDSFAFVNINRAMLWLDLSSPTKHEQLIKILFTKAHALAHDFNDFTKTPTHMDLVMGFSTSEILWYEAMSQKYTRLNKNGIINSLPISEIRWLPGSENLFVAAHFDGTIVVYDKEKEDAPFVAEDEPTGSVKVSKDGKRLPRLIVKKSVQSKNQKNNPVAFWKATNQRINGLEFSPDGRLLAIASEDGSLRILDYHREELRDLYSSYYGGLTCVCWSPDGMYLLTGGQDDLISIWSVMDRELVARCVGHRSWVSALMFDPWRCDDTTYRFGSVGDDGRLLLWDFNFGMLAQPRDASTRQSLSYNTQTTHKRKNSEATVTNAETATDAKSISSSSSNEDDDDDEITHPVLPRSRAAMLPPVLSKEVDIHPLSWISFEEHSIIVSCKSGHIRTWNRPLGEAPTRSTGSVASSDHLNPLPSR